MTVTPATPPTCTDATCERPARWVITGEDAGGAELVTCYACDAAQHQAQAKRAAWEEYNVQIVKLRRIAAFHALGLPGGEATE